MNPELRAAAERMRKHFDAIKSDTTFKESPYFIWHVDGGPSSWKKEAIEDDECALIRAYLDEHKADDDEPIDRDWLRKVGFVRGMQVADSNALTIWTASKSMTIVKSTYYWAIRISDGDTSTFVPAALTPNCRGDMRKLCAALGITLKE